MGHPALSATDSEHGEEILRVNYEKITRKAGSQSPTQKWAIRDHDTPRMDELAATATSCGVFRKPQHDTVLQAPSEFKDWTHLVGARIVKSVCGLDLSIPSPQNDKLAVWNRLLGQASFLQSKKGFDGT